IESLDLNVGHGPVRVIDHDLRPAACKRALDCRVDIVGHHRPHELEVWPAKQQLVRVRDPCDALGVRGDEYAHSLPLSCRFFPDGARIASLPDARTATTTLYLH